jgi:hypothetical protein
VLYCTVFKKYGKICSSFHFRLDGTYLNSKVLPVFSEVNLCWKGLITIACDVVFLALFACANIKNTWIYTSTPPYAFMV